MQQIVRISFSFVFLSFFVLCDNVAKILAFDNKNKTNFILYCSHLIVSLSTFY